MKFNDDTKVCWLLQTKLQCKEDRMAWFICISVMNFSTGGEIPLVSTGGSVVENLPANAGDLGLIPGSGRCSGEGHGNPLQYSCLENPVDRGAWQATVPGVAESDMTEYEFLEKSSDPCPV